jgi:outer membrane protein insertion porin family
MVDFDAPLEVPPLKPPLANTVVSKDKEPDDLDKIRKWQEERLARKLKGEYESAVLHLNELVRAFLIGWYLLNPLQIENNAYTPLNIAAIRVEGATHTRQSFLGSLVKPHFPNPFIHERTTLQDVLLKARDIGHILQATDLFQSVNAVIEPSRDALAAAEDVDIVFKTREKGRFFLKTSTEFGNNEGSAVSCLTVRTFCFIN